jgi:hypothetical protein
MWVLLPIMTPTRREPTASMPLKKPCPTYNESPTMGTSDNNRTSKRRIHLPKINTGWTEGCNYNEALLCMILCLFSC